MPDGRMKVYVATDKWMRSQRRPRLLSNPHRRMILQNFFATDFRTASRPALRHLPPSHTAGIAPCATAPTVLFEILTRFESLKVRRLASSFRVNPNLVCPTRR